ncbi:MAG: hypothetical protein A2Z18_08970 [Armatimonadetes bacterium RBG_16_58_9]|nr:MAG: hypothetical protein A2Z18_08970 [Armatimonadetes bacterium RBG_16_58_9]
MVSECSEDVRLRLKKIEGQIRGLQRMIEQGKDCSEVIHQLRAASKALDKVGFIILTHRIRECAERGEVEGSGTDRLIEESMKLFLSLS